MSIQIQYGRKPDKVDLASFVFPGGEVQVQVPDDIQTYEHGITLWARIANSDDIMELVMANDAIRRQHPLQPFHLVIPYFPYARQDRVCNKGEALAVQAIAKVINGMGFDTVTVYDPHSDATAAALDRCRVVEQDEVVSYFWQDGCNQLAQDLRSKRYTILCPDGGAMKKCLKLAQRFKGLKIINADKQRNTATGQITGTVINYGYNLKQEDLLIVDDICDGGMTFIKIAEALRERHKPRSISLYVTHGIFSKGTLPLFDSGIERIYTTDSFTQEVHSHVHVVNL